MHLWQIACLGLPRLVWNICWLCFPLLVSVRSFNWDFNVKICKIVFLAFILIGSLYEHINASNSLEFYRSFQEYPYDSLLKHDSHIAKTVKIWDKNTCFRHSQYGYSWKGHNFLLKSQFKFKPLPAVENLVKKIKIKKTSEIYEQSGTRIWVLEVSTPHVVLSDTV